MKPEQKVFTWAICVAADTELEARERIEAIVREEGIQDLGWFFGGES